MANNPLPGNGDTVRVETSPQTDERFIQATTVEAATAELKALAEQVWAKFQGPALTPEEIEAAVNKSMEKFVADYRELQKPVEAEIVNVIPGEGYSFEVVFRLTDVEAMRRFNMFKDKEYQELIERVSNHQGPEDYKLSAEEEALVNRYMRPYTLTLTAEKKA